MTDENNQIKFFLYENWARTKTGQRTVTYDMNVRDMVVSKENSFGIHCRSWLFLNVCLKRNFVVILVKPGTNTQST